MVFFNNYLRFTVYALRFTTYEMGLDFGFGISILSSFIVSISQMNVIIVGVDTVIKGTLFRKWIEECNRNYGKDPWFFLRELGQNSRDAGAKSIRVSTSTNGHGDEILIFQDDGTGMPFSHARQFFFRLYASSKTGDKYSAGMYGIGFWTVLRYHPRQMIIESRNRNEDWALRLDSSFQISSIPCQLKQRGTRITLIRSPGNTNSKKFEETVEERLVYYCGYLRRNDRRATRLPVFFNKKEISREFKLPLVISSTFKMGSVEGVVGLDHIPKISLYARGLPVWDGSMLDELFHLPSEREFNLEVGQGLAPVFLINGNNLDVNISRKTVMENRALQKVKKIAEIQLSRLIYNYTNQVFLEKGYQRIRFFIRKIRHRLKAKFWITILLMLLLMIPLEITLLNSIFSSLKPTGNSVVAKPLSILKSGNQSYGGAIVSPFSQPHHIELSYHPRINIWFKILNADQYHIKHGFIQTPNPDQFSYKSENPTTGQGISVRLKIPGTGRIILPRPVGYAIHPDTIRVNHSPVSAFQTGSRGEIFIRFLKKEGTVHYRCVKAPLHQEIGTEESEMLTALPDRLPLPPEVKQALEETSTLGVREKIEKAIQFTRIKLVYDQSTATALEYKKAKNDRGWLGQVLRIGKGDCDIINGVTTVLLRKMGIPSRLVVGIIGEKGTLSNSLHAWTEYYFQGWHTVDVSRLTQSPADISPNNDNLRMESGETGVTGKGDTALFEARKQTNGRNLWIYFLISIGICSFLLIFLFIRKQQKEMNFPAEKSGDIKKNLAKIAIGAILQPRLWNDEAEILDYQIIPTVNGKTISINQAFERSRKGNLVVGSHSNPIARQLSRLGLKVLNQEDKAFGPLINLLPGTLNLDRIYSLESISPDQIRNNPVAGFLIEANKKIKSIQAGLPVCMWSPGLIKPDYELIRFPVPGSVTYSIFKALRHPKNGLSLPIRFLAINPASHRIQYLTRLFSKNPSLALYKLINIILTESGFLPQKEQKIQKQCALNLLTEFCKS